MLLIWLHGIKKDESPIRSLFEGLEAIGRRDLAGELIYKIWYEIWYRKSADFVHWYQYRIWLSITDIYALRGLVGWGYAVKNVWTQNLGMIQN